MAQSCGDISELLPQYAANNTCQGQNTIIVRHVALCPTCRADLALWFTMRRIANEAAAPAVELTEMYAKIPRTETELDRILRNISHQTLYELARYVFQSVRTTYRLISQL